jgi:hypothetical protein
MPIYELPKLGDVEGLLKNLHKVYIEIMNPT